MRTYFEITEKIYKRLSEEQIREMNAVQIKDIIHLRYRLYSTRNSGAYWEAWKDDDFTDAYEDVKEYVNNAPYNPVLEFASKEAVVFYNLPIHTEDDIYSWKNAVTKFVEEHFESKNYILVLQYHECYTIFPNYIDIIAFSTDPKFTISPYKLRRRVVELLLDEVERMNAEFKDLQGNLKYISFESPSKTLNIDTEKEIKEIIKKLKEFGVYLPSRIKLFNHILEAENGIFIPADNYRVLIPEKHEKHYAVVTVVSPDHLLQPRNITFDYITLFYHPMPANHD